MFDPKFEYIDEVLFRGRPPGDLRPSAYHVVLAENAKPANTRVLNVQQAIAEGLDLSTLVPQLNAKALSDSDANAAAASQLQTERDAAVRNVSTLSGQLDAATSRADELLEQLMSSQSRSADEVAAVRADAEAAATRAAADKAVVEQQLLDATTSLKAANAKLQKLITLPPVDQDAAEASVTPS